MCDSYWLFSEFDTLVGKLIHVIRKITVRVYPSLIKCTYVEISDVHHKSACTMLRHSFDLMIRAFVSCYCYDNMYLCRILRPEVNKNVSFKGKRTSLYKHCSDMHVYC